MPPRFRAESPALLKIVPLDALTAIHHRRSGQSHLVLDPVPRILAILGRRDMTLEDLAAQLGVTEMEALGARLEELVATGLVARQ